MTRNLKLIFAGVRILLVAAALTFGATQALAAVECRPEAIGTCPPWTPIDCGFNCQELGHAWGDCDVAGCCYCLD